MNIKIHKKFLFTKGELINYLKTVRRFSKLDSEILATVTYNKAYETNYNKNTLISFPYKQNKELEINKRPILLAQDIGSFIKENIEENSLIDSFLIDPIDNQSAIIRPLQIKFLGKGKYKDITNSTTIEFLKRYSHNQSNKYSLIIVLEGRIITIQLREIVDWLKKNNYPFEEVIMINPNNTTGDMEFYQLKPSKDSILSIKIKKAEMLSSV